MKKSLRQFAMSIVLFFASLMLAGFAPQDDAVASMEAYVRASLQNDVVGLRAFGATPDLEHERAEAVRGFRSGSGGYLFSAEQIDRMMEAYGEVAAHCDVNASLLSEENGKAIVEVTFETIDIIPVLKQTSAELGKSLPRNISTKEATEFFTEYLIDRIRSLKPDGAMTMKIACTYDAASGVWLPDDPNGLGGPLMVLNVAQEDWMIKEEPDVSLEALAEACLHLNSEALEHFGIEREELHAMLIQKLMQIFQSGTGGRYSENQATQVAEAYLASLGKCKVRAVAIPERNGDTAVVEFTIDALNPLDMTETIREMKGIAYASDEEMLADYVRRVIEQIEKRQVVGTKKFRLNCVYNTIFEVWVPYSFAEFGACLYGAANGL